MKYLFLLTTIAILSGCGGGKSPDEADTADSDNNPDSNENPSSPDNGSSRPDDPEAPKEEDYQVLYNQILTEHNKVRAELDNPKPSSPLPEMVWNEDLAQTAQDYAAKCIWEHNPDRGDNFNTSVGENLYASTNYPTAENIVSDDNSWAGEEVYYDYSTNSCAENMVCGHYTQVAWRNSVELGCGIAFCPSIADIPWENGGYVVVCNYGPAGNIRGERPY